MLKVVKIGGNVVDNPEKLDKFLRDFASLKDNKILVHGGGKIATYVSKALGIETNMIDGRRVTDAETLKVVTMVYAGLINKTIVSKLQFYGCNALGLSGADGKLIVSKRRPALPVDYGFVGDPVLEEFGTKKARKFIRAGYTLVVAPITYDDDNGTLLNTNADTVASTIALGMASAYSVKLIYCFEKQGVLKDVNDYKSIIPQITAEKFAELKATGIITDGMLPKLENAFKAIQGGVKNVVICSADNILKRGYAGTTLIREPSLGLDPLVIAARRPK